MNSRPPPPQGAPPPSYTFVTRMYRSSLRPVVLFICVVTGIWLLFLTIGAFKSMNVPKQQTEAKFSMLLLALGIMYCIATVIQFFGIVAASTQRLTLIRTYTWAFILAALLVIAAGFMRTVVHFMYKNDLINACTRVSTGEEIVYTWGLWGPSRSETLNADEAARWCRDSWNHDSWAEILWLLFEIFLAAFFASIVLAYKRQALDPTSPANMHRRTPSAEARLRPNAFYRPAYEAAAPAYMPPPGAPPKPPSYTGGKDDPFADFEASKGTGADEHK